MMMAVTMVRMIITAVMSIIMSVMALMTIIMLVIVLGMIATSVPRTLRSSSTQAGTETSAVRLAALLSAGAASCEAGLHLQGHQGPHDPAT